MKQVPELHTDPKGDAMTFVHVKELEYKHFFSVVLDEVNMVTY